MIKEMIKLEYEEENEIPIIDPSLVDLIGNSSDVDDKWKNAFFPFFNKAIPLGNNTNIQVRNIMDGFELIHMNELIGKRKYELRSTTSNRNDFLRARAYLDGQIGLSKNGYAIEKLTSVHKIVDYNDQSKQSGGMLSFMRRGGSD
jgi:hypothetical protein